MSDKFKFVMPATLEKGEDGDWNIAGLASTDGLDQQGEKIIQKGIDLTPVDQKRGILNWDHKKGPENTIGTLDGYKRTDKGLFIKGRLFKNHSRAKAVKEIMDSLSESDTGRMGLSVEGQILERDESNPNIIKKCRINAVALTMNPVNAGTYADILKSMNASEEIEINSVEENYVGEKSDGEAMFTADQVMQIVKKALAMGDGGTKAPNTRTDGDAMATSDLKGQKKDSKKKKASDTSDKMEEKESVEKSTKKMKKCNADLYKSNMITMLDKLHKLYPEANRVELWEAVRTRMETQFPDIVYPEKN